MCMYQTITVRLSQPHTHTQSYLLFFVHTQMMRRTYFMHAKNVFLYTPKWWTYFMHAQNVFSYTPKRWEELILCMHKTWEKDRSKAHLNFLAHVTRTCIRGNLTDNKYPHITYSHHQTTRFVSQLNYFKRILQSMIKIQKTKPLSLQSETEQD